jgi:hypothetical protein
VKKLFRRRCWRFSNMRSLDLKSLVAAAKRPVGKGRDDICLVRSRSRMTGVALEWHQLRCLILEGGTPGMRERVPKTRCVPLPFIAGLSSRIGPAIVSKKTEKSVQDLGLVQIPGPPGLRSAALSAPTVWVLLGL